MALFGSVSEFGGKLTEYKGLGKNSDEGHAMVKCLLWLIDMRENQNSSKFFSGVADKFDSVIADCHRHYNKYFFRLLGSWDLEYFSMQAKFMRQFGFEQDSTWKLLIRKPTLSDARKILEALSGDISQVPSFKLVSMFKSGIGGLDKNKESSVIAVFTIGILCVVFEPQTGEVIFTNGFHSSGDLNKPSDLEAYGRKKTVQDWLINLFDACFKNGYQFFCVHQYKAQLGCQLSLDNMLDLDFLHDEKLADQKASAASMNQLTMDHAVFSPIPDGAVKIEVRQNVVAVADACRPLVA